VKKPKFTSPKSLTILQKLDRRLFGEEVGGETGDGEEESTRSHNHGKLESWARSESEKEE